MTDADKLTKIRKLLPPQPNTLFHDFEYCNLVAAIYQIIDGEKEDDSCKN